MEAIERREAREWQIRWEKRMAEKEAEQRATEQRQAAERRERARLLAEKLAKLPPPPPACCLFTNGRQRRAWVYDQILSGRLQSEIAAMLGISRARVHQIYHKAEREHRTTRIRIFSRAYSAVPIDVGGPRDVWLEFHPPPDPRFDNMAPVVP